MQICFIYINIYLFANSFKTAEPIADRFNQDKPIFLLGEGSLYKGINYELKTNSSETIECT